MADQIDRRTPLADIDPEWAWQAWEPSAAEPWDIRRVAHLYRRAGFNLSYEDLRATAQREPADVIEGLLSAAAQAEKLEQFEKESASLAQAVLATGDMQQLAVWWFYRMRHSPMPLVEKMTLFWHGHFATGAEKVLDVELMYQQNRLLRAHALGDYRALVQGIAKDPGMLIYLDSVSNRKAHANENFARELMELFCLGEGNYSEQDVQQLARCFTGWEIRRKQYRFNPYQHDGGPKRLFGKELQTGEAAIDAVLDHPQLPTFIAGKLFRYLISDEPSPSPALLEPLARKFKEDNLSMSSLLRMMLQSRWLLSDWSFGRKIRSPVEMAVGFLRSLDATTNLFELSTGVRATGQGLFYPPNVKGWDGGRAWINSSSLVGRANLIHRLLHDENTRFATDGLARVYRIAGGTPEKFVEWFIALFLVDPPADSQRDRLLSVAKTGSEQQIVQRVLSLLATMPQFHLA